MVQSPPCTQAESAVVGREALGPMFLGSTFLGLAAPLALSATLSCPAVVQSPHCTRDTEAALGRELLGSTFLGSVAAHALSTTTSLTMVQSPPRTRAESAALGCKILGSTFLGLVDAHALSTTLGLTIVCSPPPGRTRAESAALGCKVLGSTLSSSDATRFPNTAISSLGMCTTSTHAWHLFCTRIGAARAKSMIERMRRIPKILSYRRILFCFFIGI